ncbi:MAG: hypothetical protein K2H45_11525 [Acetatifactor sp.]|nr:hypothetical protein [Acetatifactor sp.]
MTEEKMKKGMNPTLSLWALLAKCSMYKVLAVLVVMAIIEVVLFYHCLKSGAEYYTLARAVKDSLLSVIFLAAFGLVCFALAWTERRLDTESSAAILRLRLSGSRIFMIKTAYNMACMVILFAVQIWLAIGLVGIYGREMEEIYASPQRLFLAFYRIDFLHCLLPMAEVGKWVRNLLLLLAFGTEAAGGSEKAEKKYYVPLIPLYAVTASWFVSSMGRNVIDLISSIVYAVVIAVNIWQMRRAQREEK